MVEQRTENPRVGGSIPPLAILPAVLAPLGGFERPTPLLALALMAAPSIARAQASDGGTWQVVGKIYNAERHPRR